eukprot:COSAG06_NODE_45915_length_351_cov_0.615079_1_plen_61_part_01
MDPFLPIIYRCILSTERSFQVRGWLRTEKALNLRAILSRPLDRPHIRQCVLCAELIKHMRE